jgi:aryl-alcohol dehydrogenase-like predicted oxidoreductase
MQYRRIGSLQVSAIGIGCAAFGTRVDEDEACAVVAAALDNGVNLLDTADMYGQTRSEKIVGRAVAGRRERVVISTKFGYDPTERVPTFRGAGGGWITEAAEGSLRRLGTDYIDLYQLHAPDPDTPIEETLGALTDLVVSGKVREIGSSRFDVDAIVHADDVALVSGGSRFASTQTELNLLRLQALDEVAPTCAARDIALIAFFPLALRLLVGAEQARSGATRDVDPAVIRAFQAPLLADGAREVAARLAEVAAGRGHTLSDLAIAWLVDRSEVTTTLVGASRPEQVRANVEAAAWALDDRDRAEIAAIVDRMP